MTALHKDRIGTKGTRRLSISVLPNYVNFSRPPWNTSRATKAAPAAAFNGGCDVGGVLAYYERRRRERGLAADAAPLDLHCEAGDYITEDSGRLEALRSIMWRRAFAKLRFQFTDQLLQYLFSANIGGDLQQRTEAANVFTNTFGFIGGHDKYPGRLRGDVG